MMLSADAACAMLIDGLVELLVTIDFINLSSRADVHLFLPELLRLLPLDTLLRCLLTDLREIFSLLAISDCERFISANAIIFPRQNSLMSDLRPIASEEGE